MDLTVSLTFPILWLFSEEIKRRNNIRKVCQVENGVIEILDANNSKCLMITVQDYSEDPDVDQIDSGAGF